MHCISEGGSSIRKGRKSTDRQTDRQRKIRQKRHNPQGLIRMVGLFCLWPLSKSTCRSLSARKICTANTKLRSFNFSYFSSFLKDLQGHTRTFILPHMSVYIYECILGGLIFCMKGICKGWTQPMHIYILSHGRSYMGSLYNFT